MGMPSSGTKLRGKPDTQAATEVADRISAYITDCLLRQRGMSLDPDVRLIEEGYLTSLETLDLVMFLEGEFRVEVDPEEVTEEHFATVRSISALVEGKLR